MIRRTKRSPSFAGSESGKVVSASKALKGFLLREPRVPGSPFSSGSQLRGMERVHFPAGFSSRGPLGPEKERRGLGTVHSSRRGSDPEQEGASELSPASR